MLSCLQELREEEMLLWVKTTLHEQLTCLKVEELACSPCIFSSFLPTFFHVVMHVGCMTYKTPGA
uniref:Uncharacterized protein n=1 Tax=Meleagris gallopavo TaxID=9103 RepID=A0A803YQA9_MELGA